MELVAHKPVLFSRESFSAGAARTRVFFRKLVSPFRAHYYSGKAISSFEKREYGKAISHCDRVLLLSPENPLAYLIRGACHYRTGNRPSAVSDLNRAIELNSRPDGANLKEIDEDAQRWLDKANALL